MTPSDRPWLTGTSVVARVCYRCQGQGDLILSPKVMEPRLAYRGASDVFSTAADLVPHRPYVWDVNGYYRELGVTSSATRTELRKAYQRACQERPGDADRLTYVLKQLLDPDKRARYDECQPGELFFDRYLREAVLRRIHDETLARIEDGEDPDSLDPPDLSDVLDKAISLDSDDGPSQTRSHNGWGFYLWGSHCEAQERLDQWRQMLADACWRKGRVRKIGVGYMRQESSWAVIHVGATTVAFLHEEVEPTQALAEAAASTL